METTTPSLKRQTSELANKIYEIVYPGKPLSFKKLWRIEEELDYVPYSMKHDPLAVLGWWYHIEFEGTPWQDEKKLYYRNNAYVEKRHLKETSYGVWNVSHEIFNEIFY